MPKISELIKTKDITLPDSGAIVTVYTSISGAVAEEIQKIEGDAEKAYAAICGIIKSWDITDEANAVLPVTKEVLGKLSTTDQAEIAKALNKE